jgi:hypothetical protein
VRVGGRKCGGRRGLNALPIQLSSVLLAVRGGPIGGGGAAGSKFPKCNPKDKPGLEKKLNYIAMAYAGAAAAASNVAAAAGDPGEAGTLTIAFLDWGAWESGWDATQKALSENNFFGAQAGATGSVACPASFKTTNACFPASVTFGEELADALNGVPHTAADPNSGNESYENLLDDALDNSPSMGAAGILQTLASSGWNPSQTYGTRIAGPRGITGMSKLLDCLETNSYVH